MRRIFPYLLAVTVFVIAAMLLAPEKPVQIVAAVRDMPAGHVLTVNDMQLVDVAQAPEGALSAPTQAVGEVLRVARTAGDVILASHLGGSRLPELAADERAVGVEVVDSAGLAGTLKPGDLVGVTAIIQVGQDTYSKVIGEGYRVLYISPDFAALDPALYEQQTQDGQYTAGPPAKQSSGTVVLAVPVQAQVVLYDFPFANIPDEGRSVNVLDLLPALDRAHNVTLSLFLMPAQAAAFRTSGVFLPELVVTPPPTPTPMPVPASNGIDAAVTNTITTTLPVATPTPVGGTQ